MIGFMVRQRWGEPYDARLGVHWWGNGFVAGELSNQYA